MEVLGTEEEGIELEEMTEEVEGSVLELVKDLVGLLFGLEMLLMFMLFKLVLDELVLLLLVALIVITGSFGIDNSIIAGCCADESISCIVNSPPFR